MGEAIRCASSVQENRGANQLEICPGTGVPGKSVFLAAARMNGEGPIPGTGTVPELAGEDARATHDAV
jgi:hypothetical protein